MSKIYWDTAVKISMCIGAVVAAYHINNGIISKKTNSFLLQEEMQLSGGLEECTFQLHSDEYKCTLEKSIDSCKESAKDKFAKCREDAYRASIDRMKQYMRQRRYKE